MFFKIIVLFLAVMMAIGMVGKWMNPEPKLKGKTQRKCKKCGSFIIGKGPCAACVKKGR